MHRNILIIVLATAALWISIFGCGDNSDSATAVEMKQVKVVVLRNGTSYRLPDAYIVVDGKTDDACYTAGPGDTDGGDCDFVLTKGKHRFVISKSSYTTLDTIYQVTSLTKTVYFPLYTL